jgi:hypothetical protein
MYMRVNEAGRHQTAFRVYPSVDSPVVASPNMLDSLIIDDYDAVSNHTVFGAVESYDVTAFNAYYQTDQYASLSQAI